MRLTLSFFLFAAYSNEGYCSFLLNWLEGLRVLHISEYIVVALDTGTTALLSQQGLGRHAVTWSHFEPTSISQAAIPAAHRRKAVSWYSSEYRRLMGEHPSRVLKILEAGDFDLLLTDVDVLWRRSPWPVLFASHRSHCEIQALAAHHGRMAAQNESNFAVTVRQPHPQVEYTPARVQVCHLTEEL